jgi:hypothetical protein
MLVQGLTKWILPGMGDDQTLTTQEAALYERYVELTVISTLAELADMPDQREFDDPKWYGAPPVGLCLNS